MTALSERMKANADRPGALVYGWAGEVQALEFRLQLALNVIDGLRAKVEELTPPEPTFADRLMEGYERLESRPFTQPKIAGRRSAYETGRNDE